MMEMEQRYIRIAIIILLSLYLMKVIKVTLFKN